MQTTRRVLFVLAALVLLGAWRPPGATPWDELGRYVYDWSEAKKQCVFPEDPNDPEIGIFIGKRCDNLQSICDAYNKGGLADACKEVYERFDSPCAKYGNCGEAALLFGCAGVGLGLSPVKICETPNDHVFTLGPDPNDPSKYCIFDRWDLLGDKPVGKPTIICGVTIEGGKVHIGGRPFDHPWYSDLTCASVDDHFAKMCAPPPPPPPAPRPVLNGPAQQAFGG